MYAREEIFQVEGTSAIKKASQYSRTRETPIIRLDKKPVRSESHSEALGKLAGNAASPHAAGYFGKMLDSSEMYCSLRYESMSGCPYGVFTRGGIAVLSSALTFLALVGIAFGG